MGWGWFAAGALANEAMRPSKKPGGCATMIVLSIVFGLAAAAIDCSYRACQCAWHGMSWTKYTDRTVLQGKMPSGRGTIDVNVLSQSTYVASPKPVFSSFGSDDVFTIHFRDGRGFPDDTIRGIYCFRVTGNFTEQKRKFFLKDAVFHYVK